MKLIKPVRKSRCFNGCKAYDHNTGLCILGYKQKTIKDIFNLDVVVPDESCPKPNTLRKLQELNK